MSLVGCACISFFLRRCSAALFFDCSRSLSFFCSSVSPARDSPLRQIFLPVEEMDEETGDASEGDIDVCVGETGVVVGVPEAERTLVRVELIGAVVNGAVVNGGVVGSVGNDNVTSAPVTKDNGTERMLFDSLLFLGLHSSTSSVGNFDGMWTRRFGVRIFNSDSIHWSK